MSIKSRKLFAMLVVAMMILTMLPLTSFAASTNTVDKVPQISVDDELEKGAPALRIKEKDTSFDTTAETFRLSLTNAEWLKDAAGNYLIKAWDGTVALTFKDATAVPAVTNVVNVNVLTKSLAEITIQGTAGDDLYDLPLYTKVTAEGEAQVVVDARDSRISSGTFTFAVSAPGKTIVSIDTVKAFARSVELGAIQIDETRIGALGSAGGQDIKIKLPPKFSWDTTNFNATFSGGLTAASTATVAKVDGRTLELTFTPAPPTGRSARGSIFLNRLAIRADRDAQYGEVIADIDGTNVTSQDLKIANYQDHTIDVEVKEVKELTAGKHDAKTAKITIKENLTGAFIAGRDVSVVLPEWVKINSVKNAKTEGPVSATDIKFEDRKNELYIEVSATSTTTKSKYEFELELSIEADKAGDIVAEIYGAGVEKQELVVAKAVAPIIAEVDTSDLKIGVQNQVAPDIIITETKKGAIDDYVTAYTSWSAGPPPSFGTVTSGFALTVSLPRDHDFAGTPTVEVTEGNLELGKPSVSGNVLTIPVKSSSTRPSTIKISNVKVTLDRTIPEGAFNAKIGGTAIVKNNWSNATITTPVLFDKDNVVKFHYADVITPAPGETRATTTFTIGSTDYTVVEASKAVEYTMDVAPYIKDGRTFLPLRYVANALGVDDDNIIWDPVTRAVTVFKGDRIAQVTINSKAMLVNGVTVNMDVAPEITDGRTMLPIRWMAQALGANIEWDAEAREVTVAQ